MYDFISEDSIKELKKKKKLLRLNYLLHKTYLRLAHKGKNRCTLVLSMLLGDCFNIMNICLLLNSN